MDCLPPPNIRLLVWAPTYHPFHSVLATLLARDVETSPQLKSLAPILFALLKESPSKPSSYSQLLGITQRAVQSLPLDEQAYFLSSQPRIGDRSSASGQSAQEVDATEAPGEVLKRLTVSTVEIRSNQ